MSTSFFNVNRLMTDALTSTAGQHLVTESNIELI